MRCAILFLLLGLSGCYKNHLYVQQEWVDASFLASSHIGTPDPRQDNPPVGQRLLVAWRFPENIFCPNLDLVLTVRFWDQKEEEIVHPMQNAFGSIAFNFFHREILTYKIDVYQGDTLVEVWEHQFWTKLIDVKE